MEWFWEPSIFAPIALSILLGGAIGLEREMHGRPAGMRTNMIVCLASTAMVLGSEFTQANLPVGAGIFSPDRVSAGIITGIGFLGAGAIMREENLVRGLTTAGCIWFVAALGIVIGKRFYPLAILITVAALMVLILFRYVEALVPVVIYKDLTLRVDLKSRDRVKVQCEEVFGRYGVGIDDKHITVDPVGGEIEIRYKVKLNRSAQKENIIMEISDIDGVRKAVL